MDQVMDQLKRESLLRQAASKAHEDQKRELLAKGNAESQVARKLVLRSRR